MHHHATLYIGSFDTICNQLPEEVRVPGSDVRHIVCDRLTIDDARNLITEASQRPVEKETRSFVLSFFDATTEAQNALLKTLEEPAETSVFYVIVPRREVLMPTVQSRLMIIDTEMQEGSSVYAQEFFKKSYKEKTSLIAEKAKEHDAKWIEDLLASTEQWASETRNESLLRAVLFVRKYIGAPGASRKMLLEYLMLAV
ncbi:hypothetical protein KTR10_03185 [Candidatus Kaiserbacteria bacterium]|nr:hypothetical protein [Candidatus Kaiserbacteria bacterium]